MLSGRITMENTIMGMIKERYEKERDAIVDNIDAQMDALDAEKSATKDASDARVDALNKEKQALKDAAKERLDALKNEYDLLAKMIKSWIDARKDDINAIKEAAKARLDALEQEYKDVERTTKLRIEALNNEKSLIAEQLQMRKDQYNQEEKAAELAKLEAQYQRIVADPTRAKEAQEIQKKISSLRQEMAWDAAEAEVKAQQDAIDAEIEDQDAFLSRYKEGYEDKKKSVEDERDTSVNSLQEQIDVMNKYLTLIKEGPEAFAEIERAAGMSFESMTEAVNVYMAAHASGYEKAKASVEAERDAAVKNVEDRIAAEKEWLKQYEASYQQQKQSLSDYKDQVKTDYDELFTHPKQLLAETEEIMQMTDDEIIAWLKENDEEYRNASAATQEQMEKNWRETLDEMRGRVKTHWDEVEEIYAQGDEAIIEFLKQHSSEYAQAGREQGEAYVEAWTKKLDELKRAMADVEGEVNRVDALADTVIANAQAQIDNFNSSNAPASTPSGTTSFSVPSGAGSSAPSGGGGGGGGGSGSGGGSGLKTWDVYDSRGFKTNYTVTAASKEAAQAIVNNLYGSSYSAVTHGSTPTASTGSASAGNSREQAPTTKSSAKPAAKSVKYHIKNSAGAEYGAYDTEEEARRIMENMKKSGAKNLQIQKYARGGLATETGLAWLDGTMQDPERVLNPYQTKLFDEMVQALERISRISIPSMPNYANLNQTGGNNVSVGDIIVNVDNLDTDADYEELAEKVSEVLMDRIGRKSIIGGVRVGSY